MRDILNFLLKSCDIFDEVSPNELRVMLWLRLHQTPCHVKNIDVGISLDRVHKVVGEFKQKGVIGQRVALGPVSLTDKGNSMLDRLLLKISEK